MRFIFTIFSVMAVIACGTTDGALKQQGKTDSYILGFHDGRHSGMNEEGNHYEHHIKDEARFVGDPEYKLGWLAGEAEGKALQKQAVSLGKTAAGTYSSSQTSKEASENTDMDRAAREAVKGVDTTGMDSLGK